MANRPPDFLKGEWQRLRRQIEFADAFWLGFVFTSSPPAAAVLRERVAQLARSRALTTKVLAPERPQALRGVLAEILALDPNEHAVIFVEALRSDPPPPGSLGTWTEAWDEIFLRANEHREALRRHLRNGLVFITIPEIKERVRQAAPDLWSIRSIVLELRPLPSRRRLVKRDEPRTQDREPALEGQSPDDAGAILAEALRRMKAGRSGRGTAGVSMTRAARALHSVGRTSEALDVAHMAVDLLLKAPPDFRRDLAVALGLLAKIEETNGHTADAIDHVRQALEIGHGETDRTMFIWLDLLGRIYLANGDRRSAGKAFDEGLNLARTLAESQKPSSWRDLSISLTRVGDVRHDAGDLPGAHGAYEESLALIRHLLRYGDTPTSLRDLSISLERVGDVRRETGDLVGASAAYDEAVTTRRRRIAAFGETPEALRDIAVTFGKLITVLPRGSTRDEWFRSELKLVRKRLRRIGSAARATEQKQNPSIDYSAS